MILALVNDFLTPIVRPSKRKKREREKALKRG
jgi:hypothetical protein